MKGCNIDTNQGEGRITDKVVKDTGQWKALGIALTSQPSLSRLQ
jgi:hypothetical protein